MPLGRKSSLLTQRNDGNQGLLFDSEEAYDLQNTQRNRRIEIFFRNRYISIGNNVDMKNRINNFINKRHSKLASLGKVANSTGEAVIPSSSNNILN